MTIHKIQGCNDCPACFHDAGDLSWHCFFTGRDVSDWTDIPVPSSVDAECPLKEQDVVLSLIRKEV